MTQTIKETDFVSFESDPFVLNQELIDDMKTHSYMISDFEDPDFFFQLAHMFWAPPNWTEGQFRDMIIKYCKWYEYPLPDRNELPYLITKLVKDSEHPEECQFIRQATGWQLNQFIRQHIDEAFWVPNLLERSRELSQRYGFFSGDYTDEHLEEYFQELGSELATNRYC